MTMQRQNDIQKLIIYALESSIYLAPRNPGLSSDEIMELGKRFSFGAGELRDSLTHANFNASHGRIMPADHLCSMWLTFPQLEAEPDFRNVEAFDFITQQMNNSAREEGAKNTRLERDTLVERAVAAGLPRNEVEAAITLCILCRVWSHKDNTLRTNQAFEMPLPSETAHANRRIGPPSSPVTSELRHKVYSATRDLVERRNDGRSLQAEPLDAFADCIERLGHKSLRMWWVQTVDELKRSGAQQLPLCTTVLAATLVEGALTFAVPHARANNLGTMGSKDFEKPPTNWRIDQLIVSASAGGPSAILDGPTQQRALTLAQARQRIHAGRMMTDFPKKVPDLRPEEARDAVLTAETVVRSVIDWLQRYPPQA